MHEEKRLQKNSVSSDGDWYYEKCFQRDFEGWERKWKVESENWMIET